MRILLSLASLSLLGACALGANPQDFDCSQADLQPYLSGYAVSPLIGEIQRDAGHDEDEVPGAIKAELSISAPAPAVATFMPDDPEAAPRRSDSGLAAARR